MLLLIFATEISQLWRISLSYSELQHREITSPTEVYYREEEPGCGVYYTNDTTGCYFPEQYLIYNDEEPRYFETIEDAAEWVSDLVGHIVEADLTYIQTALDEYVEAQENSKEHFYSLHEFIIVEE